MNNIPFEPLYLSDSGSRVIKLIAANLLMMIVWTYRCFLIKLINLPPNFYFFTFRPVFISFALVELFFPVYFDQFVRQVVNQGPSRKPISQKLRRIIKCCFFICPSHSRTSFSLSFFSFSLHAVLSNHSFLKINLFPSFFQCTFYLIPCHLLSYNFISLTKAVLSCIFVIFVFHI